MGTDKNESLDQLVVKKAERNGKLLLSLKAAVKWQEENKDVHIRQVKMVQRGGGWLLVMTADVQGTRKVAFRDLAHLDEFPGEALDVLRNTTWRADKYVYVDGKTGTKE